MQTLADLFQYFDQLVNDDTSADDLFCSSYLRGFIEVEAQNFGDEQQLLSQALAQAVTGQLTLAADELSAEDHCLVTNSWQSLQSHFSH